MKNKNYKYIWMSFSKKETPVLRDLINDYEKKHYHIQKISRFYLRFKYDETLDKTYDVDGYRNHRWGHLYWRFSDEKLVQSQEKDRGTIHLWMLFGSIGGFILSLLFLKLFRIQILYWDGLLAFSFILPVLFLSFTADNIGRCYESFIKEKREPKNPLKFAHVRALGLGLNLMFRCILFCLVVLPAFLKELKIAVIFVVLMTICYELLYYYLPHRKTAYLVLLSIFCSLIACVGLSDLKNQQLFSRDTFYYDKLEALQLNDIMIENEATHVLNLHRYLSTSHYIPLSYIRDEKIRDMDNSSNYHYLQFKMSYCLDENIALMIFNHFKEKGYETIQTSYNVDEVIRNSDGKMLLLHDNFIYSLSSTINLEREDIVAKINDIISLNDKTLKT